MQETCESGNREVVEFSSRYLESLHRKSMGVWEDMDTKPGWQKSKVNPMDVLKIFPNIWIKEDYVLRAYVFRSNMGGNGIVWAVPEGSEFPEVGECEVLDGILHSPKPENAVPFTDVIEGDNSPESYIQASIFVREMFEFGAFWHGRWWADHEIVGRRRKKWKDFRWKDVENLRPKVIISSNIIVEFYTYSPFEIRAVYRFRDVYTSGYRFESSKEVVAYGGEGFVC